GVYQQAFAETARAAQEVILPRFYQPMDDLRLIDVEISSFPDSPETLQADGVFAHHGAKVHYFPHSYETVGSRSKASVGYRNLYHPVCEALSARIEDPGRPCYKGNYAYICS